MVTVYQNTVRRVLALLFALVLLASCLTLPSFAAEEESGEETAAAVMNPNYSFTASPAETGEGEKDEKDETVVVGEYKPGFSVSVIKPGETDENGKIYFGAMETDENGNYIFSAQLGSSNVIWQGATGTIGTTTQETPKIVYVLAAAVAVCLCVIVVLIVLLMKKKRARMRTAAEMAYESKSKYVD